MAKIGPSFTGELIAAGVPLDGIAWDCGSGAILACPDAVLAQVRAVLAQHDPTRASAVPPDCLSLPWWLAALKIWMRTDPATGAQIARYADVDAAIKVLETAVNADGSANVALQRSGMLAREQFEYANSATRADLAQIAPAFGFSPDDVDESLWRADRVRLGDLTGHWPLSAS